MDKGVLENLKCYLLLCLLNDQDGSMNIVEFSETLNIKDAMLMSAKSWEEVEAGTIVKSWSKLLRCPDLSNKDCEGASDNADVSSLLNNMGVPSEESTDWVTADEGDPGYCELSEVEIVSVAREEIVSVAREENEGINEEEDDDKTTPPTVSHASTCQVLQTVRP